MDTCQLQSCCLLHSQAGSEARVGKPWPWEAVSLKWLNQVMLYWGEGEGCRMWDRGESRASSLGDSPWTGAKKSPNSGSRVYLPPIRYITFWIATLWPETLGGQLGLADLGRLCWLRPCWAKSAYSLQFTQTPCQACPESCLLWLPVLLHNISVLLEWLAPARGQLPDAAGPRAACGRKDGLGIAQGALGPQGWEQYGKVPQMFERF